MHIVLLHGLGSHTITLKPLEYYLNYLGYKKTYNIYYPVDKMTFEQSLCYVDQEIEKAVLSKEHSIVVIGQSMGGVIANNLHRKGWSIEKAIYIGSPLHGANLLNQLEDCLPTWVSNMFRKLPYEYLKTKEPEQEPPHAYKTISMGWAWSNFDGCVYRKEATLAEEHHTHLAWADHRTIFANPRLWMTVAKLI